MEDEKILYENLQDIVSRIFESNIRSITSCFLKYIKVESLYSLQLVSKKWNKNFKNCLCWKYFLTQMIDESDEWNSFAHECDLFQYLHFPPERLPPEYFRETIIKMIQSLKEKYTPYHIKLNNATQLTIPIEDSDIMCYAVVGDIIYIGHENSKITLWSIESGKKCKEYTDNTDSVTKIVYDNYCNVISGSKDGYLRLWDVHWYDFDCLDYTNIDSGKPIENLSFCNEKLFAYLREINEIFYFYTCSRYIQYVERICLDQINFIEMKNNNEYLITRFDSQFLTIYNCDCINQEIVVDNQNQPICMDINYDFLITCDIEYSIRIFNPDDEDECKNLYGLTTNVMCISLALNTILLGKTDGFIQKICFNKSDLVDGGVNLIDENYLKIEEGIMEIKGEKSEIICRTLENSIKIIKIVEREYLKNKYWRPRYVRSIEGNKLTNLEKNISLMSIN